MAATHARCTLARDCSCAAARPWQTSRAGGPRAPTSALRAGAWAACLPPPPGPAPEAETGDEVTRGGGGCEINTSGWTSSPNFRVACRLLEHGAASRGNMAGLPLFETDAMGERERHPNLGSLRSDSRSSFFASYRSIAAFLDEARALSLEQTDAAGRHLPQQLCVRHVSPAQATDDEDSIPLAPSSPTRGKEELRALPSVQSADGFCAEDGGHGRDGRGGRSLCFRRKSAVRSRLPSAHEHRSQGPQAYRAREDPQPCKPLFQAAGQRHHPMLGASSGVSPIFGFTNFFVNFTGEIVQMVRNEGARCLLNSGGRLRSFAPACMRAGLMG